MRNILINLNKYIRKVAIILIATSSFFSNIVIAEKGSVFDVSFSSGYYKYKEPGEKKVEISGVVYHLEFDYCYTFKNEIKFIINTSLGAIPNSTYNGHTMRGAPLKQKNIQNYYGVLSPRIGYSYNLNNKFILIPYLGLGYEYLRSSGEFKTPQVVNAFSQQQYLYFVAGTGVIYSLENNWTIESNLDINILIHGKQKTTYDYKLLKSKDIYNFKQKRGYGINLDTIFGKNYQQWRWRIGPYVKYWNIDDSNEDKGLSEPKNSTIDFGLKIKVTF